jgi:phosphohistidine phosphatase
VKIYLVRHAHAVDGGSRTNDEGRWLTAEGRTVARRVGARLRADGVSLDLILVSPLVRAVQTAELIAQGMEWTGPVEVLACLAPSGSARVAASEVAARGVTVAVVGHEPNMSALGAHLANHAHFPGFKKAQVCLVDNGKLLMTLDPDTL